MNVDRRDSAALISIGTLLPADPLRIGARWGNGEGRKVELNRRVGNGELKGASIEMTHQGYNKSSTWSPRFRNIGCHAVGHDSFTTSIRVYWIYERENENERTGSRAAATNQGLAPRESGKSKRAHKKHQSASQASPAQVM